jgi:hypothetical protein
MIRSLISFRAPQQQICTKLRQNRSDQKATDAITPILTVIPPNECVSVFVCHPSVDVLLSLFECNVHIPVQARQDACVVMGYVGISATTAERIVRPPHTAIVYATRQPDYDAFSDNAFEEIGRRTTRRRSRGRWRGILIGRWRWWRSIVL